MAVGGADAPDVAPSNAARFARNQSLEGRVMSPTVDVINASTACTNDEVSSYIAALQTQVTRDFAPVWGAGATLNFVASGGHPDPTSWWLAILDNSD